MPLQATIVYPSGRYPFTAAANVSPGDVVIRPDGSLAIYDGLRNALAGERIEAEPVVPSTVAQFPAVSGNTWAAAALLYWDNTNKVLTTTASGNTLVGRSVAAKVSGQTSALVVCS